MRRDIELIRKILLLLESGIKNQNNMIEGYSSDQIKYHKALILEAQFVKGTVLYGSTEIPESIHILKITMIGHDFIDAISNDTNWNKMKDFLKDSGKQVTADSIKDAVKQLFIIGSSYVTM